MFRVNENTHQALSAAKKNTLLASFLIVSAITAFLPAILGFRDGFYTRDWTLFNSLSYFTRSSWLQYKTFPLHNPYVLGGMDLLANPQARILSPMSIMDILFPAPWANLLSLCLLAAVGGLGFYRLLKYLRMNTIIALIITYVFIHGSWFSMHFTEGHIIFGSFQLIGWVVLFSLQISKPSSWIYLSFILAFMILEGGIYAFIYSLLTIVFTLLFLLHRTGLKNMFRAIQDHPLKLGFAFVLFFGFTLVKLVPLLSLHGNRLPVLENLYLEPKTLGYVFFYPFQDNFLRVPGAMIHEHFLGFMEIGAYIGLVAIGLIGISWFRLGFEKKYLGFILFALFFFWIGSGWGGVINPWTLFQRIPVIQNAHIQTRALFLVWIMLLILLAHALGKIQLNWPRWTIIVVGVFLIIESTWVGNHSYSANFKDPNSHVQSPIFDGLLKNTRVDQTIKDPGDWGLHFQLFNQYNTASRNFMDPAVHRGDILTIADPTYRGEAYFLDGNGEILVHSYTPNGMEVEINVSDSASIQFNTNYLLGWSANSSKVKLSNQNGLLTLKVFEMNELVVLKYRPPYIILLLFVYALSWISLIGYVGWNYHKKIAK
jgi:hypothetical protein